MGKKLSALIILWTSIAHSQVDEVYLNTLIESAQETLSGSPSCGGPLCVEVGGNIVLENVDFEKRHSEYPLKKPFPKYPSADAAAKGFIDFVRNHFKKQFVEYCAEIFKSPQGFFYFDKITPGSPGGCGLKLRGPTSEAVVHTHPLDGMNDKNLSSIFQIFSAEDIEYAEQRNVQKLYLGAPAGHILRYDRGTSECRRLTVRNPYKILQKPQGRVKGKLSIREDELVVFPQNIKPSYCP